MKNTTTTPAMRRAINHCKTFSVEDLKKTLAIETRMLQLGHSDFRYVEAMRLAIEELEAEMKIAA